MATQSKYLVKCSASIKKRFIEDGLDVWKSYGDVDFETQLDIRFIMSAEEDILNSVLDDLIKSHDTDDLRYTYQDYELVFHFPIKLKGDVIKSYKDMVNRISNNIKKRIYNE
jgi:hypothetical protein